MPATCLQSIDSIIRQELWDKVGELRYFGIRIPKEYGGTGMTFTDYILASEELATTSTIDTKS